MTNISIAIPDDLSDFLSQNVQIGKVSGASELVALALYAYRDQMELEQIKDARLKAEIQIGLDQIARGEFADFDLHEFLATMHAEKAGNSS
jgi:Arc/MetJ-type ribon-helix-helix transcriptional regulator